MNHAELLKQFNLNDVDLESLGNLDKAVEDRIINREIYDQLDEMDDADQNFSHYLVQEYIEQAIETINSIDETLHNDGDLSTRLDTLYQRGHFLKGSSAAIGLLKVSEMCARIQNHGKSKDADGNETIDPQEALGLCNEILPNLKSQQVIGAIALVKLRKIESSEVNDLLDRLPKPQQ